jgi:outer membrane cobalamin receptor
MGVRGNDAHQEAALVIDGLIMNDGYNGAFQMAGKFNLGQIEKLDVYVGPNSIAFGNIAALGAIVIQTRASQPFSGVSTEWSQGFHNASKDARVSSGLSIGKKGAHWSVAATTSINRSVISYNNYTDKYGYTYNMETDSWLANRFT